MKMEPCHYCNEYTSSQGNFCDMSCRAKHYSVKGMQIVLILAVISLPVSAVVAMIMHGIQGFLVVVLIYLQIVGSLAGIFIIGLIIHVLYTLSKPVVSQILDPFTKISDKGDSRNSANSDNQDETLVDDQDEKQTFHVFMYINKLTAPDEDNTYFFN